MINPSESARLAALRSYNILDTSPEAGFDDLTKLASIICKVPVSLITLLDESRQWYKSRVGFDKNEIPRRLSFCNYTIEQEELLIVDDMTQDERFRDSPLVTGESHVRFYAGAPLITPDGYALGTLCVLDRIPRSLSEDQREGLGALARQAVVLLEQRRTMSALAEALERVRTLEGLLPICSYCHNIRDNDGEWKRLETYIGERSDAQFTHGICRTCFHKHFPDD